MKLRIGTRASKLALVQTDIVASLLRQKNPNIEIDIEIEHITTTGDVMYDANLALIGGKGLFLKELEEQLIAGKIDIAVHSLKDVPAFLPEGLTLSCYLERENPFDVFLSDKYSNLESLPQGARVGTSSSRRNTHLKKLRPDLEIVPFRGNVLTRIEKMNRGTVDACVLAYAGIKRLGLESIIKHTFGEKEMIPAVGQGVICVETRINDDRIHKLLSPLNHELTEVCIKAERRFMQAMEGNCTTPIAAHATLSGDIVTLNTMYYDEVAGALYASASGTSPEEVALECSELIKQLSSTNGLKNT
jgi:hydroxymethylbilane synthase